MQAPKDIPRPEEGKLRAFCRSGWGSNAWYVMDHTGRILGSSGSVFAIAIYVNYHNLGARES